MPRVFYDADKKAAITKAAMDARTAGKTWKDAHEDAKNVGYQGSLQGIIKLLRALEERKGKTARKPGRPAGKRRGAGKGKTRGRGPGKAKLAAAPAAAQTDDIAAMVDKLVKSRFNAALDQAIATLKSAKE